jgi:hypothetical protein
MRALMELMMGAQARGVRLLEAAAAGRLAPRDLLFWAAAAGLPVLLVGALDLKLGLLGLVVAGYALECALRLRGLGAPGGWEASPRAPWAARGATLAAAAAFAGWRLRARGRAHRELVAEVKALRAALERVRARGRRWSG